MGFLIDFFSQPAIIAALVVLVGLIALKKSFTEIISGTINAFLGFIILLVGATTISGALSNFGKLFQKAFNMHGLIPSNEASIAVTIAKFGSQATFIFVIALILNIVIARFTKYKYIFLSSDHAFYMACCVTPAMILSGMNFWETILFGSIALGSILCIFPAIAHPAMKKITGRDDMSFAHFGTIGYWLSSKVGGLFKKNAKSIDEIKFPKGLAFLQDSNVSVMIVMAILFYLVTIVTGPQYIRTITSTNPYVWALLQSADFSAGIMILVMGVNILLKELSPAFKGFSDKIVPSAVPGYPFAVLFKGTSNAIIAGFLASLAGGILSMLLQIAFHMNVVIPGLVTHFFCGGIAAIFGNATGGKKGALIGPFINGIITSFLPLIALSLFGTLGFSSTYFSDSDFLVIGIILGLCAKIGKYPLMIATTAIFIFPFIATVFSKQKAPVVDPNRNAKTAKKEFKNI